MLLRKAKGWFTGYNSNIKGHEEGNIRYVVYNGGSPKYMSILRDVAEDGYAGLSLSTHGEAQALLQDEHSQSDAVSS